MTRKRRSNALSIRQTQRIVEAAAKYMDRNHPDWDEGVRDTVKGGSFSITNPEVCVIGAGTGVHWTQEQADAMERSVARTLRVPKRMLDGLTADEGFEPYWIVEAFRRGQQSVEASEQ